MKRLGLLTMVLCSCALGAKPKLKLDSKCYKHVKALSAMGKKDTKPGCIICLPIRPLA